MDLSMDALKSVKFNYDTIILPPPFCYRYELGCSLKPESVEVKLNLEYYDRDTIDEDEIFNEGFSLADDYQWEGELNQAWKEAIEDKLSRANWRKKIAIKDMPQACLICKIQYSDGIEKEFNPDKLHYWEGFLQEIIQAVFEKSKKELPLKLVVLEIDKDKILCHDSITFNFSERNVEVVKEMASDKNKRFSAWGEGQKLLKSIFLLDYDYQKASLTQPIKPGFYINTGDSYWHDLKQFEDGPEQNSTKIPDIKNRLRNI